MSFYTFFYPPKGYYNKDNLSVEELSDKIDSYGKSYWEIRKNILLGCIDSYYSNESFSRISLEINIDAFIMNCKEKAEAEIALMLMNQNYEFSVNHADCDSEYLLEESIDNEKKFLKQYKEDILLFTKIKFVKKPKEERYAEDDEDEMSYLRNGFKQEIVNMLEGIEETVLDMVKDKLMLDNFKTKKNENELSDDNDESSDADSKQNISKSK